MGSNENLESRERRIEKLESVHRISLLGIVVFVALTVVGIVFAGDLSVSRIACGIIGVTFVMAFAVQRQRVGSLLKAVHHEPSERR